MLIKVCGMTEQSVIDRAAALGVDLCGFIFYPPSPRNITPERAAALEALCKRLHEAFREQNRGRKETVLWESDRKAGRMGGYTGNYLRVERPWDVDRVGTLEEIIL